MSAGIDYGHGLSNIDTETGIRFGVISVHSLEWWYEAAEPDYGPPHCPKCGNEVTDNEGDDRGDYWCACCEVALDSDACAGDEATMHYGTSDAPRDGYVAFESELGVFVTKSPYYTLARFCSPCVPGAGDLNSPDAEGARTYCLGHDWFGADGAPYTVYSVATGEEIKRCK